MIRRKGRRSCRIKSESSESFCTLQCLACDTPPMTLNLFVRTLWPTPSTHVFPKVFSASGSGQSRKPYSSRRSRKASLMQHIQPLRYLRSRSPNRRSWFPWYAKRSSTCSHLRCGTCLSLNLAKQSCRSLSVNNIASREPEGRTIPY